MAIKGTSIILMTINSLNHAWYIYQVSNDFQKIKNKNQVSNDIICKEFYINVELGLPLEKFRNQILLIVF